MVGKPATASYVAALHRYVAELGLADAVRFGGHASDPTVASAYAEADVLVVTSEHEGFCVPVVEAMAAGLPVVAFDQGAVPEVLGGAGVLVSDKDPYALAAAIGALLADAPRRAAGRGRAPAAGRARPRLRGRPFVDLLVPLAERGAGAAVSGVHQFVPMLHRADAVGRHTLRLRESGRARDPLARSTSRWSTPRRGRDPSVRPLCRRGRGRATSLVYQFATASAMPPWLGGPPRDAGGQLPQHHAAGVLRALGQRHGAPPAPGAERAAPVGARAALGLAVSAFNETELARPGSRRTAVVPPAASLPTLPGAAGRPDAAARRGAAPAGSAWAASRPTRASSTPSWRCWSHAPTRTPAPRSRSWGGRSCLVHEALTATSPRWA